MRRQSKRIRDLGRRQLDQRLEQIRKAIPALRQPQGGWIVSLRTALGMSQRDLAIRMGVTRQAIGQLERRESDGSATLKALQGVAHAMGGQLVFAIVPDLPIAEMLQRRAHLVAQRMTSSVHHTMRLEDQETDLDLEERTREVAGELLTTPSRLWSVPDAD